MMGDFDRLAVALLQFGNETNCHALSLDPALVVA